MARHQSPFAARTVATQNTGATATKSYRASSKCEMETRAARASWPMLIRGIDDTERARGTRATVTVLYLLLRHGGVCFLVGDLSGLQ
jgi:hypothetical protein